MVYAYIFIGGESVLYQFYYEMLYMIESIERKLPNDAIDLHVHTYPEIDLNFLGSVNNYELSQLAVKSGLRAFVIKSHVWPTVETAYLIGEAVSGVRAFGSITLNVNVGGLSPAAVESAAKLGARVVWMPTWSASNDIHRAKNGNFRKFLPWLNNYPIGEGLIIQKSKGNVLPEVAEILKLVKQYDLILGTGHLSVCESLLLAEEARMLGIEKFVFTHPLSPLIGATLEEVKEIARKGYYVEFTYLDLLLQHTQLESVIEIVNEVGADRCILVSDAFFSWTPPSPEMMRMFVCMMLDSGVREESIEKMVCRNPAKLLGFEA